jgi:hypothetical protein
MSSDKPALPPLDSYQRRVAWWRNHPRLLQLVMLAPLPLMVLAGLLEAIYFGYYSAASSLVVFGVTMVVWFSTHAISA